MTDETELASKMDLGQQAESIVNHPLFIASLGTLKELTIEKFEGLEFSNTLEMQECNVRLNLIEEFESNLHTVIQNGNAAFTELESIQTFQKEINNER